MKYSELWKNPRPCPFCNVKQDDVIAENETAYLTYALAPYHPDHLLVVPKKHVEHILDITPEAKNDISNLENKGWEILKKLGYESVSYIVREGKGSGMTVLHTHFHVIPEVRLGDVDHNGDLRTVLTPEEATVTLKRLRAAL